MHYIIFTHFMSLSKKIGLYGLYPTLCTMKEEGHAHCATLSWIYPLYITSLLLGLVVVLLGFFLRLDEILAGLAHRIGGVGRNQVRPLSGVGDRMARCGSAVGSVG